MLRIRLLLLLLFVAFAVCVALLRPLPTRADSHEPAPVPPDAGKTEAVVPQPQLARVRRPASAGRSTMGRRVVDYAKKFVGVPYVWGGSSPQGFDCSGLIQYVYKHFGVGLPRTTYAQFVTGRRIARRALRPGDLVFFDGLGHAGIYVGSGRFIHAPRRGTRVRVDAIAGWYSTRFDGARRPSS